MSEKRVLAQPGDTMVERNLAIMASRRKELDFVLTDDMKYRGFLAGLDEFFLQICLSSDSTLILVNRDRIVSIIPTERSLEDLPVDDIADEISKKIKTFVQVSSQFVSRS
jgi:hypothetical protein